MFSIVVTQEFQKHYNKLPSTTQRKIEKQQALFQVNPFHPSLNTEKLQPKERGYWSLRVDKHYRIIFRFLTSKEILMVTVGTHDSVYRLIR